MTETAADAGDGAERPWARIALAGTGLLVAIVAFLTTGDLAAGVVSALRGGAESAYLPVMALGGVAVALAALAFLDSRDVRVREPPTVERPTPAPEPGERFDARIDRWRTALPVVGRRSRDAVRERLRRAAIRTVAAERGWTDQRARVAVDDGSWTDDPVAARFLADDGRDVAVSLRAVADGEPPLRRRARRATAAIVACRERSRRVCDV